MGRKKQETVKQYKSNYYSLIVSDGKQLNIGPFCNAYSAVFATTRIKKRIAEGIHTIHYYVPPDRICVCLTPYDLKVRPRSSFDNAGKPMQRNKYSKYIKRGK